MEMMTKFEMDKSFEHNKLRKKIAVGFKIVLSSNFKHFKEQHEWRLVANLIEWTYMNGVHLEGIELLCAVVEPSVSKKHQHSDANPHRTHLTSSNLPLFLDLVRKFMTVNQQHKLDSHYTDKLFKALFHIIVCLPAITGLPHDPAKEPEVVEKYVIPIFQYMKEASVDMKLGLHNSALAHLQRALLSPELTVLSTQSWLAILDCVVFPLLECLQHEAPPGIPKEALNERRLKAAQGILCKTFLQHLALLVKAPNFLTLWMRILNYLEWYMNKSELLQVAVTEALKNILMVMHTSDVFGNTVSDQFWDKTWAVIGAFAPKLHAEFETTVAVAGDAVTPPPELSIG